MRNLLFVSILVLAVATASAVPETMSYQGVLREPGGGVVPDGMYNLTFRIYAASTGGTALWTEMQSVPVEDGIFNVVLGEVVPLTLGFDMQYWLGVQVASDPELSPRVKLTSAPYAHRAGSVDPDIVSSVDGVTNDEGDIDLVAGANVTITPNDVANTITISSDPGASGDDDWAFSGSNIYRLSGNVGIGTNTPSRKLHVAGNVFIPYGSAYEVGSTGYTGLWWDSGYGNIAVGDDATHLRLYAGSTVPRVTVSTDGNVGIGTMSPYSLLHVYGDVFVDDGSSKSEDVIKEGYESDAGRAYEMLAVYGEQGAVTYSRLFEADDAADQRAAIYGYRSRSTRNDGTGYGLYYTNNAITGANYWGDSYTFGVAGYCYNDYTLTGGVLGAQWSGGLWCALAYKDAGSVSWGVYTPNSGYIGGPLGLGTDEPAAQLDVLGSIRISDEFGEAIVEMGEGSDIAQGFEVNGRVSPGSVVVIDDLDPGRLVECSEPYDTKVAGVVAGGRDTGSVLSLGVGEFDSPVALAGRVYCNVDATAAGVEPGDLLTTSTMPGFAMKVTDPAMAHGAILGKAMERLERGSTGQILVLVALQ